MRNLTATLCLTIAVLLGSAGVSFALPKCEGSPLTISDYEEVKSWSNCEGEILFGSEGGQRAGNKYTGEWKNGKIHGQGTYVWADGKKYIGGWLDQDRHGYGIFKVPGDFELRGEFKNNRVLHADIKYAGGNRYTGEYGTKGRHGQGILLVSDGQTYIGQFKNNLMHGQGIWTFADGRKYFGVWKSDKQHGIGMILFTDGKRKIIEFKDGKELATKENITPGKTASNNQQGDVKQQSPQKKGTGSATFAKEGVYLKVINIKTVEDSDGYPQCKISFRITNATKIKWKLAGVAIKAKVSNDKSMISDIPKWSSFSLNPGEKKDFSDTWKDPDEDLPCGRVTAFNFAPSPSLNKRSVRGKKFKNNSEAYKHFLPLFAVDPTHNTAKFHPFKFNTKLSEYYGKKN